MSRDHYQRTVAAGVLSLFSAGFFVFPSFAATSVTAVRFWTLDGATRVVIEITGEFQYTYDRVPDPDRIFFDVHGASMRTGAPGVQTIAVGDSLIKQIRVAETQPGVTRVVFDLEASAVFMASQLTNPDRLIVEFRRGIPAPALTQPAITQPATQPAVLGKATPGDAPPQKAQKAVATAPAKIPELKPPRPATLPRGSQSMARVLGLKIGRIVLDAGHGGHDTGTIGPGGSLEKDVVLDIAKRLGTLIESEMGSDVIYTRTDDTFVGLEARTQIANTHKADLFLSIHANSSPLSSSSGVETYYLSFTTSKAALEVAARENASSQKTVYELKDLLQKIVLQDKVDESREFAARIQQNLYTASARANSRTRNRGVKQAPFVVLIGASMPSVLAEIGFLSNPRDEALLKRPETRQKIAEGLYKGLAQYASTLSQSQVASN